MLIPRKNSLDSLCGQGLSSGGFGAFSFQGDTTIIFVWLLSSSLIQPIGTTGTWNDTENWNDLNLWWD